MNPYLFKRILRCIETIYLTVLMHYLCQLHTYVRSQFGMKCISDIFVKIFYLKKIHKRKLESLYYE